MKKISFKLLGLFGIGTRYVYILSGCSVLKFINTDYFLKVNDTLYINVHNNHQDQLELKEHAVDRRGWANIQF